MPTLYVENVPEELYESLRARARCNRRSISAETLCLLEQVLPTASEVRRRAAFYHRIQKIRSRKTTKIPGPSAAEFLREDRQR
jgi:plasmid stability protein